MFNSKITSNICSIFFWSDAKTAQNDSHLIICRLRIFLNLDWSSNNQMKRCRERDGSPVLQIYTCKLMNANTNTDQNYLASTQIKSVEIYQREDICTQEHYPYFPKKIIGVNLIALAIFTINLPPGLHHLYTRL